MKYYRNPIPDRDTHNHIETFNVVERLIGDAIQRLTICGINAHTGALTVKARAALYRYRDTVNDLSQLISELNYSLESAAEDVIEEFILKMCDKRNDALYVEINFKHFPPENKDKGIERSINLGNYEAAQHVIDLLDEYDYECDGPELDKA